MYLCYIKVNVVFVFLRNIFIFKLFVNVLRREEKTKILTNGIKSVFGTTISHIKTAILNKTIRKKKKKKNVSFKSAMSTGL